MRTKVLHVIGRAHGGAGVHLLDLAKGQQDHFDVSVAMARGSEMAGAFRAAGLRTLETPISHSGRILPNLAAINRVAGLIRRERFDVIHGHTSVASAIARVASRWAGNSVTIHTLHNFASNQYMPVWKRQPALGVERLLDAVTDHYVAPTCFMAEEGVRRRIFHPENVTSISHGIDLKQIDHAAARVNPELKSLLSRSDRAPIVAFVGRLDRQKGADEFLKAAAEVVRSEPSTRFVVAGDGREKRRLVALAAQLSLDALVSFVGWQANAYPLLAQIDLLVMPSRWEPFGLAAAEAMALRKPVVATAVDGLPEVIEDGVTGRLVAPGDPTALATGILELVRNPGLRTRMGEQGRKRVEKRFTIAGMVDAHRTLYDRLLGRSQRRAA
jgi:glycosyltransferase involved in cell wall biosynthesis